MTHTIQIKRGTRAQIEAARAAGLLKDGEPYLITDETRLAIGTTPNGYSSFLKLEELVDKKVAITPTGSSQFLWGESTNTGAIQGSSSVEIEKDINNSFIKLAVANVDFGTF